MGDQLKTEGEQTETAPEQADQSERDESAAEAQELADSFGLDPEEAAWGEGYERGCKDSRAEMAEKLQRWIDWTRDGRELRRADLLRLRDDLLG